MMCDRPTTMPLEMPSYIVAPLVVECIDIDDKLADSSALEEVLSIEITQNNMR
jgi:hypothetical protein